MAVVAQILTGLVLLIHVYIVLIETVLFKSRGRKVFAIAPERVNEIAPMFSNQGCYNGFLVAALVLGFVLPNATTAQAFTVFGLLCVAVAGIWGALTVSKRILFVQTVPAVAALLAGFLAS
jgi:putative membrane protein